MCVHVCVTGNVKRCAIHSACQSPVLISAHVCEPEALEEMHKSPQQQWCRDTALISRCLEELCASCE